jgi:hypothetical protein
VKIVLRGPEPRSYPPAESDDSVDDQPRDGHRDESKRGGVLPVIRDRNREVSFKCSFAGIPVGVAELKARVASNFSAAPAMSRRKRPRK